MSILLNIIEEKYKIFCEKIKKINFLSKKNIIEEIEINFNDKKEKIKKISTIELDKENNIIIIPFYKELKNIILKSISRLIKNDSIIVNKEFLKILNNKIIGLDEKNELIRYIKKEKELVKNVIKEIRRKEINGIEKDFKKKKSIQEVVDIYNSKIDKFCEEKIKKIK